MAARVVYKSIAGTGYYYDSRIDLQLAELRAAVDKIRKQGGLSAEVLSHLRQFFRVKNIYHSNAIEGNLLDYNETRLVVEEGLTITGKPLKDTLEAKNLSQALDLFEGLANRSAQPITEVDIRSLHSAVLQSIDDGNAGKYRDVRVEISGSEHKPPGPESVAPEMEKLSSWLQRASYPAVIEGSEDPIVLACAAHAWFVYVHPFTDGNGRVGRLLMNLILMRYGYPIAIITRDDRQRYYDALKESDNSDLTPFIGLVHECVTESLEEYQKAAAEHQQHQEWAQSILAALGDKEAAKAKNEYEVWRSAMELLKNYFKQIADILNEQASQAGLARVSFRDFGMLEFENYLTLRNRRSVKKTWCFGVQFTSGQRKARYLFFFGYSSPVMGHRMGGQGVTLHVAYETTPAHYERIENIQTGNLPDLCEIGYLPQEEQFVYHVKGTVAIGRVESFGRTFFEQIAKRQF